MGRGDKIRFEEYVWRGDEPFASLFPLLYNLSLAHNVSISSMAASSSFPHFGILNFSAIDMIENDLSGLLYYPCLRVFV